MSVNEIIEVAALSWSLDEENDDESNASTDLNASLMEKAKFEAARTQVLNWIASIITPLRQSTTNKVNTSPYPMQQLVSNSGNTGNNSWRNTLFETIREK